MPKLPSSPPDRQPTWARSLKRWISTRDNPALLSGCASALTELEESLIVWHTFLPEGERALFQPIWEAATIETPRDRAEPPPPVGSSPAESESGHPSALAWDLLTLLRWLGAGTPTVAPLSSATVRSRRRVNELLWNTGVDDEPQPGYLELLAALADQGNLLDPPDAESRANPALRAWRSRSFDEQSAQLLFWWLGAATWIEAQDQEDVVVSGAHWPQFRRRVLVLLASLDPDGWFRLDELARWLSRRSSDALGDAVQIATARPVDARLDRSVERLSSLEQVVERTLRSGFAWFGLIEIRHIPSIGEVLRLTDLGLSAAGIRDAAQMAAPVEPPLSIHPDLIVTLHAPTPVRIWSLTAFADQIRLRPEPDYRITNRSLKRALTAGFHVQDVVTFLEKQSGLPLDDAARTQLVSWADSLGRVWLAPALVVQAEQDEETRALRATLTQAGLTVTPMGATILIEGEQGMSAAALAARVEAALTGCGKDSPIPNEARIPRHWRTLRSRRLTSLCYERLRPSGADRSSSAATGRKRARLSIELRELGGVERAQRASHLLLQQSRHRLCRDAAFFGQRKQHTTPVVCAIDSSNISALFEPIDQSCHDGRRNHQPTSDIPKRGLFAFDHGERGKLPEAQAVLTCGSRDTRLRPPIETRHDIEQRKRYVLRCGLGSFRH